MAALGSKTTAEQALQRQSLQGKKAIVTGANSGLGVETARLLALAGVLQRSYGICEKAILTILSP